MTELLEDVVQKSIKLIKLNKNQKNKLKKEGTRLSKMWETKEVSVSQLWIEQN
jgi:hypothetical protein